MSNWTGPARITNDGNGNGQYTTTAEYKDGDFYIFYDSPNDEDPALYIDDDLMDGVVGTNYGIVFSDPSHGSDTSIIRTDEDGRFHLIYEEWSPIDPSTHAWDSPLAGHTSSVDGINGFTAHKHHPAVDHRTNPTNTFGTYKHPNDKSILQEYEIHEPAQDAYGDWTTIKIGSRYYLFGDFDDHEVDKIKVGIFHSDSIYEEFERVGAIGNGHPDPTVAFAEGQFYLITQKSTDYVSPGPWIKGVEARAGVDIDGDGDIDEWTNWKTVKETYDHKPGYARVVDCDPAQLDLSGLSSGYGFRFEFRIDDTVVSGHSPIIDRVEFAFEPSGFQAWSNDQDIVADPHGDHNQNGLENLIEFATGLDALPEISFPERRLDFQSSSEALSTGYGLEVAFSDDLKLWKRASDELLEGISLDQSFFDGNGNYIESFLISGDSNKIFWRIEVE
ncbi:MAG: hypothetical protein ACPGN3_01245 [Opitutales bacterium]